MQYRAGSHFPTLVTANNLFGTILIADFQLKNQSWGIVPHAAFHRPVTLVVPSVAQYHTDCIGT